MDTLIPKLRILPVSLPLSRSVSLCPLLPLSFAPSLYLHPSVSLILSQGPAGLPGIPGMDGIRGLPGTVIMMPVRGRQAGLALGSGVLTQEVGPSCRSYPHY